MNNLSRHIALMVLALAALCAHAVEEPHDTVCFYDSWENMFIMMPDTMIVDPMIDVCSPFEVYIETGDKKLDKKIKKGYMAATLGDTTWVINSYYVRKNFKGDSKNLHGYVPFFFNDKVAYAVVEEYSYAGVGDIDYTVISTFNYYFDFDKRKVHRVDYKMLDALLADYPDLRMRYQAMKNNKRQSMTSDFFLDYVDRVTDDPSRPCIVEMMSAKGK